VPTPTKGGLVMRTVTEIEADVRAEIALDPRIPNVD